MLHLRPSRLRAVRLLSFAERTYPDGAIRLLEVNLVYRIAHSMPLGGFEFVALDGFGFVPVAFLYTAHKLRRPAWVRKAAAPAVAAGLAPGAWAHFLYMPAYGSIFISESTHWLAYCMVLFLAAFTAAAFAVYLATSERRLDRERRLGPREDLLRGGVMDYSEWPAVEMISSGIVLACCIFGLLVFGFCLLESFFGDRLADGVVCLLEDNLVHRIANSMPLGGFEFCALNGFGFVPVAFLYTAHKLRRPAWVRKAAAPAVAAGLAPGAWAHFLYMPAYGSIFISESSHWLGNCMVLFLAAFTAAAFAVYLATSERRLERERSQGKPQG